MKTIFFFILAVIGAFCVILAGEVIAPMERVGLFNVF